MLRQIVIISNGIYHKEFVLVPNVFGTLIYHSPWHVMRTRNNKINIDAIPQRQPILPGNNLCPKEQIDARWVSSQMFHIEVRYLLDSSIDYGKV